MAGENGSLVLADLEPIDLEGQPSSDKAFRCLATGARYRVRVELADTLTIAAPVRAGDSVAPGGYAIDIFVVEIDDAGAVRRNAVGEVEIAANTRWTVDDMALGEAGFDPAAKVMQLVRTLCAEANSRRSLKLATAAYLSGWGVDLSARRVSPPEGPQGPALFALAGAQA